MWRNLTSHVNISAKRSFFSIPNYFFFSCKVLFLLWTYLNAITQAKCDWEICVAASMSFSCSGNISKFVFSLWKYICVRGLLKLLQNAYFLMYICIWYCSSQPTLKKITVMLQFHISLPAHPSAYIFLPAFLFMFLLWVLYAFLLPWVSKYVFLHRLS